MFEIIISKQAKKDIKKLETVPKNKLKDILVNKISKNPFLGKKLVGELKGYYSYRLNKRDRIVYRVDKDNKLIIVLMLKRIMVINKMLQPYR